MTAAELIERYGKGERYFLGADLRRADLSRADLSGAYLYGANLSGANLSGANLSGAGLSGANLSGADLYRADLGRANLSGAYLYGANLSGAYLYGANLSGAGLRYADLRGAYLPPGPVVADIDKKMADACSAEGALGMGSWHTCKTTHCRAGWAITLAGEAGAALERELGPAVAGTLIYNSSAGYVPDFYCDNETALADIMKRAGR